MSDRCVSYQSVLLGENTEEEPVVLPTEETDTLGNFLPLMVSMGTSPGDLPESTLRAISLSLAVATEAINQPDVVSTGPILRLADSYYEYITQDGER